MPPIDCRWFIHRGAISMVHKQDVQMITTIPTPTQPLFFFTRGHCFFVSLLKGVSRCFWWGFAQPRNLHFNKTWGELKEVVAMFEVRDPARVSVHKKHLEDFSVKSIAPYRYFILRDVGATLVQKKRPAAVPVIWSSIGPRCPKFPLVGWLIEGFGETPLTTGKWW